MKSTALEMKLHWATVLWSTRQVTVATALGPECLVIQVSQVLIALTQISFSRLAPNSPTNVEITGIDSYSIRVTWSPPDMNNCTDVDEYRIICYSSCYIIPTVENTSHSLNTIIQYSNSVNSCVFSCCVSGNNSAGVGPASCVYGRECF